MVQRHAADFLPIRWLGRSTVGGHGSIGNLWPIQRYLWALARSRWIREGKWLWLSKPFWDPILVGR